MGKRHNRRRTRPQQSQYKKRSFLDNLNDPRVTSSSPLIYTPSPIDVTVCASRDPPYPISSALFWQYGYPAWQKRERKLRFRTEGLEAEQCLLFGGEPGDDLGLCYRMLEYFGGLDYIDPWVLYHLCHLFEYNFWPYFICSVHIQSKTIDLTWLDLTWLDLTFLLSFSCLFFSFILHDTPFINMDFFFLTALREP